MRVRDVAKGVLGWVFGEPEGGRIRLVERVGPLEGLWVSVRFGGAFRPISGVELTLGDPPAPGRLLEIAAFAGRRGLPVDGWLVDRIGAFPDHLRGTASWLHEFSVRHRGSSVVATTEGMSEGEVRRLAAQLRRYRRRRGSR